MKNIYNTLTHKFSAWLLLVAVCMGMSGCKKELLPMVVEEHKPAYISLSTKSLNTGIEVGSKINTVRVILIDPAANHTVVLNEFIQTPVAPLIIPVMTGTYDVYVVANEQANGTENAALSSVHNLPSLRAVDLPFILFNRNLTNIPMFGEVKNVTIIAPIVGIPSPTNLASVFIGGISKGTKLPVELDRMASKVSIKIVSQYNALTSAKIENAPSAIPLFGDALLSTVTKQEKSIDPALFASTATPENFLECKDILIPSWMFADATDKSQAMVFQFVTDGKTFSTELGHLISGATIDYRIKRNYDYEITITMREDMIFAVVTLKPWNTVGEDINVPVPKPSMIIGNFGGWNGTEYTKPLEVEAVRSSSDPSLVWSPNSNSELPNNIHYGPTNINIMTGKSPDLSKYPAAKYCYDKGDGWYLPSYNQLMAIWILYHALPEEFLLDNSGMNEAYYWSSTEYLGTQAWYISFYGGHTIYKTKNTAHWVRCVRDVQ